jgi:MYXO-CTERM domain-containing protein
MNKPFRFMLAAALLSLAAASTAWADVAPTGKYTVTTCDGEDKAKCSACDRPDWDSSPNAEFDACAATAKAKGLVQNACTEPHGGGGYRMYYFCPSGVTLTETTTTYGGGCSIGGDSSGALLGLLGAGILAGLVARRRRAR